MKTTQNRIAYRYNIEEMVRLIELIKMFKSYDPLYTVIKADIKKLMFS